MSVRALDHVQLAMPVGGEAQARRFYAGALGIPELAKPAHLAVRGGCWFERGPLKLHLGVDPDFRPARKAHPGLLVDGLAELRERLAQAGFVPREEEPLDGYERVYVDDPFGNRLELMESQAP
jgi:catechol 2,3-dioxygenase-like lactoylglutathione lyase family enzyme